MSEIYISPANGKELTFDVKSQMYMTDSGDKYPIIKGVPDFTFPYQLCAEDEKVRLFYDDRVEDYEKYLHLTFYTHNTDERAERISFIDKLCIKEDSKVLEIACGTGRDSELILERLSEKGELYLQDISSKMVEKCKEKIETVDTKVECSIANAAYLPFPDNYFDAVYSFGGLGEFSDIKRSLKEMVRVCRIEGKVVVGDESIPPWLRDTEYAQILTHTNPQFAAEVPLEKLPLEARNVNLSWVIGGVFYLIDFVVGAGEPDANFDFKIPGIRGGTYRTRYYGQLEGVTPEAYELAHKARQKTDKSMHEWLDTVVKKAGRKELSSE